MRTLTIKSTILFTVALFLSIPAFTQKGVEDGSKYGQGQDSINCLMNLSLYTEFYRHNNYNDAILSWRKVFRDCPAASENTYIHGIKMYKKLMSTEQNPEIQQAYVDTIMMIYDQRIQYFDKEAYVLAYKATDLLRFRRDDVKSIEEAYGYLKKSIELDPDQTKHTTVLLFSNASISLYKAGILEQDQTIKDYFTTSEIIDKQLKKNPNGRFKMVKENIDNLILDEGVLTCEALNDYYGQRFEANKDNEDFLNKMIDFYYTSGCDRSDMYVAASEQLYAVNPSHESAYKLARLFVSKSDFDNAAKYYLEATTGEADSETMAKYYYELAQVIRNQKDICKSIEYARKAVKNKADYGDAYILLGDLYIESRKSLGEDFEQRAAFWAAVDKYIKAKNSDPTVADEATKRINDFSPQFPDSEACFFRSLKDGDSYQVKGCINEYTTIRARK